MKSSVLKFLLAALALVVSCGFAAADDGFALRDGDVVVFLGDSLTAARTYGKYIENYTLLRYPDRKVTFINAGFGGDTAEGGLKRLEADVLTHNPTVVTVMYGTNDIGWGVYADEPHKQRYLAGVRGIVSACVERKIRVYLCSEPVTAADPNKSEDSFLQKMCDEGMELSKSLGGNAIDVQRSMREAQKRLWAANEGIKDASKRESMHVADGVHLNELGQLAVAHAMLRGLGAPAEVSEATVDYTNAKASSKGCRIVDARRVDQTLEFTRIDDGLPFNYGTFFALHYRFVPVPQDLAKYMLTIKNLPAGRYDVLADGREVSVYSAKQLADGVNITFATTNGWVPGGPWNVQANALVHVTNARHEVLTSAFTTKHFLPQTKDDSAELAHIRPTLEQLEALQRDTARPRPYRFVIKPHVETDPKK